jgi:hypothetical protein
MRLGRGFCIGDRHLWLGLDASQPYEERIGCHPFHFALAFRALRQVSGNLFGCGIVERAQAVSPQNLCAWMRRVKGVHNGNLPLRVAGALDGSVSKLERPHQRGTCREKVILSQNVREFSPQQLEASRLTVNADVIALMPVCLTVGLFSGSADFGT